MSEENKESRINVEDLPRSEKELTPEEAREVQGGAAEGRTRLTIGDDQGVFEASSGPHVKVIDGTKLSTGE